MKKIKPKDTFLFSVLTAISIFSGLWLGEHESGPLPTKSLLSAIAIIIMTILISWRMKRSLKLLMVILMSLSFILPWYYGNIESTNAYNECIEKGENVRIALLEYFQKHHEYPNRLNQLQIHLPGQLIFPPHTLNYKKTETGYLLYFSDWLVSHDSNETHGFIPQK